jgi:glucose-1-phosphate adenylyltransferase
VRARRRDDWQPTVEEGLDFHVGIGMAWDYLGTRRSVRVLPPFIGPHGAEWYRGTADALYQNIDFLDMHQPDDVLIVSGDHAYNTSYEPLLRYHMEKAADATLAFTPVEKDPSRFGIAELTNEGRIVSYMEKPEYPRSNLASMTVYVFRREVLVEELERHAESSEKPKSFHIYDEILPRIMERRRVFGWVHHGSWDYSRTLDAYYQAQMDLLGENPQRELTEWHVRTNMERRAALPPPTRFAPGSEVIDSIISGGCTIEGRVERSVLSPDVRVGRGAVVRDSVLWHGAVVGEGAVVDKVICDKRCTIGAGARVGVGEDTPPNDDPPSALTCGVTVLGMDVEVPPCLEVGRNCIIYPRAGAAELTENLPSGTTVTTPRY